MSTAADSASPRVRVLVLLNTLGIGGAEVFAVAAARAMDPAQFEVSVGTFRGEDTLGERLREAGISTVRFPSRPRRIQARTVTELVRYLRRERIDVVQTHLAYSGIIGRLAARLAGVPVVVSTEQVVLDIHPPATRRLNELTLALADSVVCISRGVLESLEDEGLWARPSAGAVRRVIHNGVDAAAIDARAAVARERVRRDLGYGPSDFVIGNVGRLVDQKGQRYLVEALARLLPQLPNAHLFIAGKGPLENDLARLISERGLTTRARLLGERTDIPELLAAMDLFAFPTNFEGLGVVLVEALAARRPVVATETRGVVDVILHERTGLLIPPRDPEALAHAIAGLANDPRRAAALAEEGRRFVEAQFTIEAVTKQYEALYLELLATGRRRRLA